MWIIGIGTAIVVLLIALIVIIVTDDGNGEVSAATTDGGTVTSETVPATSPTTEAPGTTGTTAPPPTEAPAPTVPTTTTTTTAPVPAGPSCVDVGPMPGGATNVSAHTADIDGDGMPDDFAAYTLGGDWFLWANLSDGNYRLVTPINMTWSFYHWNGTTPGPLVVQGPRTLGDPRQVVSVRIYQGLGSSYALFVVEDCEIVAITKPDGTIPELWQAMGPAHTDFPVCDVPTASVRQVVLSCFDLSICPDLDATIQSYAITRDPALATITFDGTALVPRPDYLSMLGLSCIGPGP